MNRSQRAGKAKTIPSSGDRKQAAKAVTSITQGNYYKAPNVETARNVIQALREELALGALSDDELSNFSRKLFKDYSGEISAALVQKAEEMLQQGWSIVYPSSLRDKTGVEMVEIRIVEVGDESRHTQNHLRDSLLLFSANKY